MQFKRNYYRTSNRYEYWIYYDDMLWSWNVGCEKRCVHAQTLQVHLIHMPPGSMLM